MFKALTRLSYLHGRPGLRYCSSAENDVQKKLADLVKQNKIVLFMKGTPDEPMCGFSRAVIQMIDIHGVERKDVDAHNVLEDDSIRQGIKDFTSWPTIPQVFIEGDFVGGCDIMLELHKSGELIEQLKTAGIKSALADD